LEYVTDTLDDGRADAVFPLFADESLYVADRIQARSGDSVLDVGTGSGVLAISAAVAAGGEADVTALDIQERALRFAAFNAYANRARVAFLQSDGLAKVDGSFDLVLFNPPFNPAPGNQSGKVFSHGGDDGMRVTRKIFAGLSQILNSGGQLQMVTFSLGGEDTPLIFEAIEEHLGGRNPRVDYTHLYPPLRHLEASYFEHIFGAEHRVWYGKFTSYPVAYYMHLAVGLDAAEPGFRERPLDTAFEETEFSGSWAARIRRLRKTIGSAVR
jgi:release factor glutamine methyltransferase